jgi:hypothetical protein
MTQKTLQSSELVDYADHHSRTIATQPAHFLGRQFQKSLKESLIVRTRNARRFEHLIVGQIELIIPEWRPEQGAGRLRYSHGS